MRPSPAEVRRWFAADVIGDGQFTLYLTVLIANPTWPVVDRVSGSVRSLSFLYVPTRMSLDVVLDRRAGGWRPRVP